MSVICWRKASFGHESKVNLDRVWDPEPNDTCWCLMPTRSLAAFSTPPPSNLGGKGPEEDGQPESDPQSNSGCICEFRQVPGMRQGHGKGTRFSFKRD